MAWPVPMVGSDGWIGLGELLHFGNAITFLGRKEQICSYMDEIEFQSQLFETIQLKV
ncbi:MAG: hypothetical protein R6W72_00870 [Desulfurivibrionaceae bacterium]